MFHIKSKYMDEIGTIQKAEYRDGTLAVVFSSNEGNTTLSVNLADYGATPPEDHFFVKNYSEGEGMVEAIEKAGIAEALADFRFNAFDTTATLMKLVV